MILTLKPLYKFIGSILKKWAIDKSNTTVFYTTPKNLTKIISLFKDGNFNATTCFDVVAWDQPGKNYRFNILYLLISYKFNTNYAIGVQTNGIIPIPSLSKQYNSTTWSEREIWDMFGIFVEKTTDLRRLLTDYGFRGHPLRKYFPLSGFIESAYDDTTKIIKSIPVELSQAYRIFTYPKRWNI